MTTVMSDGLLHVMTCMLRVMFTLILLAGHRYRHSIIGSHFNKVGRHGMRLRGVTMEFACLLVL